MKPGPRTVTLLNSRAALNPNTSGADRGTLGACDMSQTLSHARKLGVLPRWKPYTLHPTPYTLNPTP